MGASDISKLPHIGESVRRKEDVRFLTGAGNYTDDITNAAQTYAVFVRSPHAHAVIKSIDTSAAAAMPGVVTIFVGTDLEGKMGGLPCGWLITSTDGTPMKEPPHPVLALGKVRHVGDPVAMVIAHSVQQAKNAAEAVAVDYDMLDAVGMYAMPPRARPCMTLPPTTTATSGRWATRRRWIRPLRVRHTSPR
jgi:carbon-monoxide dehydrogenase large subunit